MLSMLSDGLRAALVFASSSPFMTGAEWGLAILVPLMIIAIGATYVLGLRTTRSGVYENSYVTDFARVSCRSRAVGCLISLVGLALLLGGAWFLIAHS